MKKIILILLFIPVVFSCSEELDTQPFLEEYNGVVWKDSISNNADWWLIFKPESVFGAEYIDKIGCSSEISQFGIVNPEGELITVQENSTNLLILDFTDAVDSNNNSRITISVSENGNVLNFENKTVTNDLYINKYMRVNSEPCK